MRRWLWISGLTIFGAAGCASLADPASSGTGGATFGGSGGDASADLPSTPSRAGGGSNNGAGGSNVGPGPGNTGSAAGSGGGKDMPAAPPPECAMTTPDIFLSSPRSRNMVSAGLVRGALGLHTSPAFGSIRSEELLDYYHVSYDGQIADPSDKLFVVASLGADFKAMTGVLQIGVQALHRTLAPPVALTIVVDTSASMSAAPALPDGTPAKETPLDRAKAAVTALAKALHPGDTLSLVTTTPEAKFAPLTASESGADVTAALGQMKADGGDDLQGAMTRAYDLAIASLKKDGLNRVVLITDGGAPATAIDTTAVKSHLDNEAIQVVGVGVGSAIGYHGELLEAVTAAGHGADVFLDDAVVEPERLLHARFEEVMDTAARNVKVRVALPPSLAAPPLPTEGYTPSDTGLSLGDLAPGRTLVFRVPVTLCGSPNQLDTVTIEVDYDNPDGTPAAAVSQSWATASLLQQAAGPMAKAQAILAFGDALKTLSKGHLLSAKELLLPLAQPPAGAVKDDEAADLLAQLMNDPLLN